MLQLWVLVFDIAAPRGSLVVDVGAGTTDMAVISLSGISSSRTVQLAGDNFDDEIMKYVRRKHNLIIGKKMAEQAKVAIGCVYPRKQRTVYRMKGSHSKTGMPHWADVTQPRYASSVIALLFAFDSQYARSFGADPP